jgi:hypothetical protein
MPRFNVPRFNLVCASLAATAALAATPAHANFVLCHAYSQKVRQTGPIVTAIHETRAADAASIRYAFVGYLRSTYAPYGNNWQFSEAGAQCQVFAERPRAEAFRATVIGPQRQAGGPVFQVAFTPSE